MEVKGYTIEPRADLYKADLYKANLKGALLIGANLTKANLTKANLTKADQGVGASGRGSVGRPIGRRRCEWRPESQSERPSERVTRGDVVPSNGHGVGNAPRILRLAEDRDGINLCPAGLLLLGLGYPIGRPGGDDQSGGGHDGGGGADDGVRFGGHVVTSVSLDTSWTLGVDTRRRFEGPKHFRFSGKQA